jgi:hypothetical protein
MEKVVPLFKSFTIIFYLKNLEFKNDTLGSNQFKSFLKYSNKSRRVLFSLGPAHFPSSLASPRSPGVAHATDSLLPCSRTTPTATRLRWSRVLPAARPPPHSSAPYRTPPLSLSCVSHLGPFSPIFPPLSRCKEATQCCHLSSPVLHARFLSPQPAHPFATCPRHQDPCSSLPTVGLTGFHEEPLPTCPSR